jgi:hypothetical protein
LIVVGWSSWQLLSAGPLPIVPHWLAPGPREFGIKVISVIWWLAVAASISGAASLAVTVVVKVRRNGASRGKIHQRRVSDRGICRCDDCASVLSRSRIVNHDAQAAVHRSAVTIKLGGDAVARRPNETGTPRRDRRLRRMVDRLQDPVLLQRLGR